MGTKVLIPGDSGEVTWRSIDEGLRMRRGQTTSQHSSGWRRAPEQSSLFSGLKTTARGSGHASLQLHPDCPQKYGWNETSSTTSRNKSQSHLEADVCVVFCTDLNPRLDDFCSHLLLICPVPLWEGVQDGGKRPLLVFKGHLVGPPLWAAVCAHRPLIF